MLQNAACSETYELLVCSDWYWDGVCGTSAKQVLALGAAV